MTYVIPYLLAARLVWGVIAPGAPSYAPGQVEGRHEDCTRHVCVAPCRVVRRIDLGAHAQQRYFVELICR